MNAQEIINQNWTKTRKATELFALGYTRRQVADLVCAGNYGFAYNIWKKWSQNNQPASVEQILEYMTEFAFNRKFGVELEFYNATFERLENHMNQSGLAYNIEHYNHQTRRHWKFVSDSSVQGINGRELVSPPLQGNDGLADVRKACKALRLSDAKVNQSCGLHVHLDASDYRLENFKTLAKNWVRIEAEIDKMMPESRRSNNNRYCQSNNLADIQTMIDQASTIQQLIRAFGTRYLKLNLSSYQRHGTVEFRHHSGTVNYTKIKNWILICARLVEASKQGIIIHDTKQFLNENLQEYFEERQLDFA